MQAEATGRAGRQVKKFARIAVHDMRNVSDVSCVVVYCWRADVYGKDAKESEKEKENGNGKRNVSDAECTGHCRTGQDRLE